MKIWIDGKGNVRSNGTGSIEKQHAEFVKILSYLQLRIGHAENIVTEANEKTVAALKARAAKKAGAQNAR